MTVTRLDLIAALAPFAAEGRRWAHVSPAFDHLRMHRSREQAEFTVGDLKRAAEVFAALTAGITVEPAREDLTGEADDGSISGRLRSR